MRDASHEMNGLKANLSKKRGGTNTRVEIEALNSQIFAFHLNFSALNSIGFFVLVGVCVCLFLSALKF